LYKETEGVHPEDEECEPLAMMNKDARNRALGKYTVPERLAFDGIFVGPISAAVIYDPDAEAEDEGEAKMYKWGVTATLDFKTFLQIMTRLKNGALALFGKEPNPPPKEEQPVTGLFTLLAALAASTQMTFSFSNDVVKVESGKQAININTVGIALSLDIKMCDAMLAMGLSPAGFSTENPDGAIDYSDAKGTLALVIPFSYMNGDLQNPVTIGITATGPTIRNTYRFDKVSLVLKIGKKNGTHTCRQGISQHVWL
jgi:hypothetical protein